MSKTGQKSIRLLLIDDHALFRESVSRLFSLNPDLRWLLIADPALRPSKS